jgi:putative ABC transport system permease protein
MGVIGSLGISALLMVAFLSWTAMDDLMTWQYGLINNFTSRAVLAEEASDAETSALIERYEATPVMETSIELCRLGEPSTRILSTLQVFEAGDLLRLTDLARRFIPLEDDRLYLSAAAARTLGVDVGERLEWRRYGESDWHEATIDTINCNPLIQGLTMTPKTLEGFGVDFEPGAIVSAQMMDATDPSLQSVTGATEIADGMDFMLDAMVTMTLVMIVTAVLIGVFIMYNLGTLTFSEMERELATLKVVGFGRRRIVTLLSSQNLFLSLLGLVGGVPLGWLVTDMIFKENGGVFDQPIFIHPHTVALALATIVALCAIVSLLFVRKVARLDMVSSLKSPE